MMSRPKDWSPVELDSDPVSGDPEAVAKLGRRFRSVADAIRRQTGNIEALCGVDGWQSDAANEFRKTAEGTVGRLKKVLDRFETAADLLGEQTDRPDEKYASVLASSQQTADKARNDAERDREERDRLDKSLDALDKSAGDYEQKKRDLTTKRDEVDGRVKDAIRRVHAAKNARNRAGEKAARALEALIDHDKLKDSTWENIKGALKSIADIAGWVATACALASLLVGWIPVIGWALAGVLDAIALLATVVSFACHLVLVFSGDASIADLVLDGVALLTLGLGRAALSAGKAAAAGVRGVQTASRSARADFLAANSISGRSVKAANTLKGKATKAANQAAEEASQRLAGDLPGAFGKLGEFKHVLNPKVIYQDTVDAVKGLKDFKDVGRLFGRDAWRGSRPFGNPEWVESSKALKEVPILGKFESMGGVKFTDYVRSAGQRWLAYTAAATAIDGNDKLHGLTEWDDPYNKWKTAWTVGS
ncbi:putative T7SS-secreted protein [Streptomyces sp. NPDC007851]|uniref:putative T7SS-secreted protein n=1 Tax=Streptomyces sp. NPDC007851 TaxID=3155008 RepID=UPI0033D9E92B